MMNYIWLGLIVAAVALAGYRDATGIKAFEEYEPVSILQYAQDDAAAVIGYDLSATREVARTLDVAVVPPAEGAPEGRPAANTVEVALVPDGGGLIVRAVWLDADGEKFVSEAGSRLAGEEPVTLRFALDGLLAHPDNPTAKASKPLTLHQLVLARTSATPDEELVGELRLEEVRLTFPRKSLAQGGYSAESWMGVITESSAKRAEGAISLAISLIGIMMLWLGLMRIAEKAGMVQMLARGLRPVLTRLFPELPPDGEAMGAIVMNIAANMLGLGNAATPLGIKAMEEMQKVNPNKEYASNSMCMLLAINTSSVTLIPPTIIAVRAATGSTNLMAFWPLMIGTTIFSTIMAVLACKLLEKLPMYRIPASETPAEDTTQEAR